MRLGDDKKVQRGFSVILVLVGVLAIVLVGGGAFILSRQNIPPKIQSQVNIQKTNPQISPSPSADEAANWKEYRNLKLNYSLKYPGNWTVEEVNSQDASNGSAVLKPNPNNSKITNSAEPVISPMINIVKYYNPNHEDFKALITENFTQEAKKLVTYTKEIINNQQVYRTTTLPSEGSCEWVFFKKDDDYIQLNFCPYDLEKPFAGQEEFHNIFNQILSTFKFN